MRQVPSPTRIALITGYCIASLAGETCGRADKDAIEPA